MSLDLSPSAQRVQTRMKELGIMVDITEMPDTTRTAAEAAAAIGCTVGQIAKSIVFRGETSGKPVLVIASGAHRVNEESMASRCGEPLKKASADFVRNVTGYAIGGVPPVGFGSAIETWIDESLLGYKEVWAAAGTPFAVFRIAPEVLLRITGGKLAPVA